jgi:hypothetical protein
MKVKRVTGWKTIKVLMILAVLGLALFEPAAAQSSTILFSDGFETDQGWGMFEEIVGGNPCYGTGIGEVARSTDVAFSGAYSLRVWANKAGSLKSNHVIGQKQVFSTGQTGRLFYSVQAYIAPETANSGETGPEFSMQNTRQIAPGQFRTTTAGIQYRANRFSPLYATWAVWAEVAPGVANWVTFTQTAPLVAGAWYSMIVEADYTTNQYVRFAIFGPGVQLVQDLSSYHIAQEAKFNQEAFWLTLEDENLFNNCGTAGSFNYKVYYDNAVLGRESQHIGVPAYFYPGADWQRLNQASPTVQIAIINPNSGPGTSPDPNYQTQVRATQQAGVTVLGYVATGYTSVPVATVQAQIDRYVTWYGVNGIFLDEITTNCADAQTYYATLSQYIHSRGRQVIMDPGTQSATSGCFMAVADILVTFEGFYSTYATAYTAYPWNLAYPANRFWHIVHSASDETAMRQAVALSWQRNAGWVYVTNLTEPNPYGTLPADPYWSDEVAAVASH